MIVPATLSDAASMIATAMNVIQSKGGASTRG
jgi:hypothetical protein